MALSIRMWSKKNKICLYLMCNVFFKILQLYLNALHSIISLVLLALISKITSASWQKLNTNEWFSSNLFYQID